MAYQRIPKPSSWNPPDQEESSQFASRPFAAQVRPSPGTAASREEVENEAFEQSKFEAVGLQLKEKRGTLSPVELERLSVLQTKVDDYWSRQQSRASRLDHSFARTTTPHQRVETPASLPALGKSPEPATVASDRASIQRYSLKKADENGRVYSVVGDKSIVVGMGKPNHELYVEDRDCIAAINKVIEQSPLETYVSGDITLFDQEYLTVGLRFKTQRRKDATLLATLEEESPFLHGQMKKKQARTTDLHEMYEKNVAPEIAKFRQGISDEKESVLSKQAANFKQLAARTQTLLDDLNLFKKVSISELASLGSFARARGMAEAVRAFIVIVERIVNSKAMTKEGVAREKQALLELWFDEVDDEPVNLIGEVSQRILDDIRGLHKSFDKRSKVDMVTLQSYLFQQSNLESLSSNDSVMLYRACDVMSATLVGNKITKKNQQNLKSYEAGGRQAFHYATKVLAAGGDWVSLEGFAASSLEKEISGTGGDVFRNLDNTWQFIMQGSLDANNKLSGEDRYFELYTKLRYFLKGIHREGEGGFSEFTRSQIDEDAHKRSVGKAFTGDYMNPKAWEVYMRGKERQVDRDEVANEIIERIEHKLDPTASTQQNWDSLINTGRTKDSPLFGK